jgi:2'-5' RNA ligase
MRLPIHGAQSARYNCSLMMQTRRYALVAYVRNPVGEFVEHLRRELHPELPHLPAHLTVLPPRCLQGGELSALAMLEEVCSQVNPFEITLGDVETFVPVTPTVFIRVAHAAYRMRELHDQLNTKSLAAEEEWPYMPHLTIVKMSAELQAHRAFTIARDRWAEFKGGRHIQVQELTFVREEEQNRWVDLAGVPLGPRLVSPQTR